MLSWTPPTDIPELTGYKVERYTLWRTPATLSTMVPRDHANHPVTLGWGPNFFYVWAVTAAGVVSERGPVATANAHAGKAPVAMTWNENPGGNTVGNTTATVSFDWKGPIASTTGGYANTVRVTASPGVATIDIAPASGSEYGVTGSFRGLTNGTSYAFSAVTSNACGSSGSESSTLFTPGVAPTWTRNTPPLRATSGQYVYKFAATGEPPTPTYKLSEGAPTWLAVSDVAC